MKIISSVFTLLLFLCSTSWSQPDVNITDDDWTSSSTNGPCGCSTSFNNGSIQNFHDSGGSGGSYSSNENENITFCPDATGSKVVAVFATNAGYTFDVDPSDTIFIYDGPDNTYPLLAKLNNSLTPNGANIPASWSNMSGCLTIEFKSDGSIEGTGWDGNISCSNLAQPFSNHMIAIVNGESNGANDLINDMFPEDTGYVDVCLGDTIWFNAQPYFPYEPGGDSAALSGGGYMQSTNHTTTWEFSDGTTQTGDIVMFVPPARNGYFVQMKVEDSYGIFQYIGAKVRVSTIPNFSTCRALEDTLCPGQSTILFGGVTVYDTVGVDPVETNFPIGGVFGAQTYLPDGSGQNYTTDVVIAGFTPGGTVQNPGDIDKVCVSIEHSYLGDLEMMLTCPNGQNVNIFNSYSGFGASGELFPGGFGGGSTFLGGAYDNNTGNIGVCEEYCFTMQPGALPSWDNGYATTNASGPSAGQMIIPGYYEPEQSYIPALAGCPINGTWTITVRDNIGIDDGYICEWGIYFNDTLNPNTEFYAPQIASEFWYPDPTIIIDDDTLVAILPNGLGNFSYIFEVEDNFGCSYDTTINVVVNCDDCEEPTVEIPAFDTICTGNNYTVNITSPTIEGVLYNWLDANNNVIATGDTVTIITEGLSEGTYNYTIEASNFCETVTAFTEILITPCELPNVITPNGDGNNDFFYTRFAELHNDVQLLIFNRWGRVVYKTDSYGNDWDGVNMKGKKLADGTYFYVMHYNNNTKSETGTVNIMDNK